MSFSAILFTSEASRMDQLAFFGWYLLFCLVFNLLDHLVFFDDVSKFWVFAQVISGKNGVLASRLHIVETETLSLRNIITVRNVVAAKATDGSDGFTTFKK